MSDERPAGDLWLRDAQVVGVDFPERTIELIVIPYNREAVVPYQGRMVREVVDPGAFDGIERRANRVRVNRDHNLERTVGRATKFHPSRTEGLVGEIRIAKTALGDETLELADDGCLDASAGFLPMDGGMRWETRGRYRVTKAWLGHIALLPEPAYDGARVLAVRGASATLGSSTPNLDLIRSWRLTDRLGSAVAPEG